MRSVPPGSGGRTAADAALAEPRGNGAPTLARADSRPSLRRQARSDAARQSPATQPNPPDHSERLLQQMRRCVLVHHQLSCLLIHSEALRAGIYPPAEGGQGGGSASIACADRGQIGEDDAALHRSIQNLGGSTARLFSMALHDQNDLEALGVTLQERVDEMIAGMQGEFDLAGCNLNLNPGLAAHATPMGELETATPTGLQEQLDYVLHGPGRQIRTEFAESVEQENAELAWECRGLATELSSEEAEIARLRAELEDVQQESNELHHSVTVACFDRVLRAEERNEALEATLERLVEGRGPSPEALLLLSQITGVTASLREAHDEATLSKGLVQTDAQSRNQLTGRGASAKDNLCTMADLVGAHTPRRPQSGLEESPGPKRQESYVVVPPKQEVSAEACSGERPVGRIGPSSPVMLASPESLAQLDVQLRVSQNEFWGL